MRASAGPSLCVHRALAHRLCSPHFACISTARFASSSKSELHDDRLSLSMLDSAVERAARQKGSGVGKAKAKVKVVAARATPVDIRSFPFAEKEFSALNLSRRVLQRVKQERLELPTDVQVCC